MPALSGARAPRLQFLSPRGDGQPYPKKNKERADGAIEQRGHGGTFAEPGAECAGEPGENQTPDGSGRDESQSENKKRDRFRRRGAIDELRQECQEKQSDLGIQDISQNALTKRARRAALPEMRGHGQLVLVLEQRANAEKNQIGGAGQFYDRERPRRRGEKRGESERRRASVTILPTEMPNADATPARRPCAMLRPRM
jgi:hypothetical protein